MVATVLQETRYRQRYLDGIVNHDHVRNIFVTRARIVQYVRKYLDDRQFLEVMLCWIPPVCTTSPILCQARGPPPCTDIWMPSVFHQLRFSVMHPLTFHARFNQPMQAEQACNSTIN